MADEARLHDLLDLVEQARAEGDKATEAKASAAYKRESMPEDVRAAHEGRLGDAQVALTREQTRAAPGVGDFVKAGADLATSGLSHAVVGTLAGGAAGLGARATMQDPAAAAQWVDDHMVYHPQTELGQNLAGDMAQGYRHVLAPVADGIMRIDRAAPLGEGTQRVLGQTLGTAGDIASVLPGVGALAKSVEALRALKAAKETALASTPADIAKASGHVMLPSTLRMGTDLGDTSSRTATLAESLSGTPKLDRQVVRQDLTNSNDLAAQGIGLAPKTTLTDAAIKEAKAPFAAVYNKIRKYVPGATLSDDTRAAIAAAGRGTASKLPLPANIQTLQENLAKPGEMWTSNEVLDTMSDLRNKATKDLMSNDSDIVARGHAQLDMAKALESHLDEQLNQNRYLVSPEEFKAARTGFAKIYTVDNARFGHDVDPKAIADFGRETRLAHGESANTGELGIIENNATFSPHESQGMVPRMQGGANNPLSAAWQTAAELVRAPMRSVLLRTRGEMGGKTLLPFTRRKYMTARENPALANFFPDNRPARVPDLTLDAEGKVSSPPVQEPLHGLGDMNVPMAESTQNPRTTLTLKQPPGPVIQPANRTLDLGQGDDYLHTASPTIDEIIAAMIKQGGL